MAFCNNCGTQLKPDTRFCDNCGTPVPTAAQEQQAEQAAPRQGSYTPPVQQDQGSYTPPAQQGQGSYIPPAPQAQASYTPPVQQAQSSYTPPAQQAQGNYTPPVQQAQSSYTPPVQQAQGGYAPPAQQYGAQAAYAAQQAAPKQKKPIDKRLLLFGGIGVAVVVIGIILALVLGGKGGKDKATSDDPNVGVWNVVAAEMWGMEMDIRDVFANGFTVELLEKGKCKLNIDGTKGNGTWTLKDGVITIKGGGLDVSGTLKNGLLVLEDVMGIGLNLSFRKDGADSGASNGTSAPGASGADYFVLVFAEQDGVAMEKDDLSLMGAENDYVLLKKDGSVEMMLFGQYMDASWANGKIEMEMGSVPYTVSGDKLSFETGGLKFEFERSADTPPPPGEAYVYEGFISPTTELMIGSEWYGVAVVSNFKPEKEAAKVNGPHDMWGYFDTDSDGRPFFELYDTPEMEDTPLLSLYINLYDTYFQADIGHEDAWLLGLYLDESDEYYFSPTLNNGALRIDYHREGSRGSYDITIFMRELGTPWDEDYDPYLPEGYEEYKVKYGLSGDGDPAPAPAPSVKELLPAAALRTAYDSMNPSGMTYEEVRELYMDGVDGELYRDEETIRTYKWQAEESESQTLYISFKKNDAGKFIYSSRNINNIS